MNTHKTMRAGLIAVAALVLVGMLFVPAVAAADAKYVSGDAHFNGAYPFTESEVGKNVTVLYDGISKKLTIENNTAGDGTLVASSPLNITQFGLKDEDVAVIEVASDVNLSTASDAFKLFTNAELQYFGDNVNSNVFGTGKKIYKVTAVASTINVTTDVGAKKNETVGTAMTIETDWAVSGQKVKIAVQPLQNFSVYGWNIYNGRDITGNLLADGAVSIVKSTDPEDGATTYILTMPAYDVTVEPLLRDSGSTVVTYVFLDADTYVMEIPADFSLKGVGASKKVTGKMVNITGCDLLEKHVLTVKMNSTNGYKSNFDIAGKNPFKGSAFTLKNVKTSDEGAYTIQTISHYLGESSPKDVMNNDWSIFDTSKISGETELYKKLEEGNLKTELQFTLQGISETLGKYKDKLTFTVEIKSTP